MTPDSTKTSDAKTSLLDLTPVGGNMLDPRTLTEPTDLSTRKEKAQQYYVPEDLELEPSLSDSSSSKFDSSDDRKYSESKSK